MQLIPRYLLNNINIIIATDTGFQTEFFPVYTRQIKLYKGIENKIQFKLLNADQKPIDVSLYTPMFVAFDSNNKKIIEQNGIVDTIKGLFTVTISENVLLNIDKQFLRYNIYLVDSNNEKIITYTDNGFNNNSSIYVDDYAFPGPVESHEITRFIANEENWITESISAEPGINGNEALHTLAIYSNNYQGTVVIQVTLDNNVISNNNNNWANIATIAFTGNENTPIPYNFYGVFNYLRLKFDQNPTDKISKILVRN